ncbi:MAG: hypothetical protein ACREXJ_00240 [Gammaproteobacteria bacterium]
MTQTAQTRTFEIDLAAAGLRRPKDFAAAVSYMKRLKCRYDGQRKVWTMIARDGDTPDCYELWEFVRRMGVTYTEVTDTDEH